MHCTQQRSTNGDNAAEWKGDPQVDIDVALQRGVVAEAWEVKA